MEKDNPIITFCIPCYNSAAYMDVCIASIAEAPAVQEGDVEILIIDDGSDDDGATAAHARAWEEKYPGLVRLIRQPNGGPGEAINTGLANARGMYFKVVDSDDWLGEEALSRVLTQLRRFRGPGNTREDRGAQNFQTAGDAGNAGEYRNVPGVQPSRNIVNAGVSSENSAVQKDRTSGIPDMLVCNYVYEYEDGSPARPVRYTREFPQDVIFGWDDMLHPFPMWQYMMMHSAIFRTDMLRGYGLHLPAHTFYVDEIVIYTAAAHAERLMYLDVDLYHYLIGRADQSVNEEIMASRCDQQVRVGRIKIDAVDINQAESRNLRKYLTADLTITMCFCTVFCTLSGRPDHFQMRDEIWDYLKAHDRKLWHRIRWSFIGWWCNLRSPLGVRAFKWGYRTVRNIFKFN